VKIIITLLFLIFIGSSQDISQPGGLDSFFPPAAGEQIGIDPTQRCMADQWPRPERLLWGMVWSSGGLALSEDNGTLYESAGSLVWSAGGRLAMKDSELLDVAGRLVWSG